MTVTVNWLFVDLNSYFASVEQELVPELRGQPLVIVPIEAENACSVAASYRAKAYGIKRASNSRMPRLRVLISTPCESCVLCRANV